MRLYKEVAYEVKRNFSFADAAVSLCCNCCLVTRFSQLSKHGFAHYMNVCELSLANIKSLKGTKLQIS